LYIAENGKTYFGTFTNDQMTSSFEWIRNDCPYTFVFEESLLQTIQSNYETELSGVNKMIFRFMGELRELYSKYCPKDADGQPAVMRREHIWKLVQDCRLPAKGFSLGISSDF
jgi:hypothetical protein